MGKIICLMGKSSTGKDTIYKKLMQREDISFRKIIPYTTRPIRAGEENGVEYYFTDEEGYQKLLTEGKIIEGRAYETFHGLWRYFTVDDGQIEFDGEDYCIIGTLESYQSMKKYFGADKLLPVLVELDDGVRLERALNRERSQNDPKYEEMCRRFLADSVDFSEEKIKEAQIEKRFCNDELDRCLEEIVAYIRTGR